MKIGFLAAMFCVTMMGTAQTTGAPDAAIAAVTGAHAVFLEQVGRVSGQEDIPGRMFRTALEGTKRFTLLPSTRGADVVLVLNTLIQPLELDVRDSKTFALLDALQVSSPILLTTAKDKEAITKLLQAFFALDRSGPEPPFTVAPPVGGPSTAREEWSPQVGALSPYPSPVVPKEEWSAGHSVLVVSDPGFNSSLEASRQLTQAFVRGLGSSTGLRFVETLAEADLVIIVKGREGYATHNSWSNNGHVQDFLNVTVYDAKTFTEIVSMEQVIETEKVKKGKPSPEDVAASKMAATFAQKMAKTRRRSERPAGELCGGE